MANLLLLLLNYLTKLFKAISSTAPLYFLCGMRLEDLWRAQCYKSVPSQVRDGKMSLNRLYRELNFAVYRPVTVICSSWES